MGDRGGLNDDETQAARLAAENAPAMRGAEDDRMIEVPWQPMI